MWPLTQIISVKYMSFRYSCIACRITSRRYGAASIEHKYSEEERNRILKVINEADNDILSKYEIAKPRLKHISQWKTNNGGLKTLSDIGLIEGFSERISKKFFDSILKGPKVDKGFNKIKGQVLHPNLSPTTVKNIKTALAVYVSVNSVCWTLIDKNNYEVLEWKYYGIDYPEGKKFHITDILDISWQITNQLPTADIYVMKAEATTLRAAGSDPNNPKVLAVNLQKAQMVSMIVALISARDQFDSTNEDTDDSQDNSDKIKQKVYFLRPTLPYRLYGTLVGNERVSTDQTVELLLQTDKQTQSSHFTISEDLKNMFRSQKDLQKDMLGHSLLLGLTFMDLCVYKDENRIAKLLKKDD